LKLVNFIVLTTMKNIVSIMKSKNVIIYWN